LPNFITGKVQQKERRKWCQQKSKQGRCVCVCCAPHIPFFRRVDALRAYFKEFFEPRVELINYFAFCAHLMLNTLQIEKLQIVEVHCLMEIIKQVKSIATPF
jgi:hypothetical protein